MVKRIIYHLCNLDSFIYNKTVFFIRKPQCKEMPHIGGSTRTILFIEPGTKLLIGDNVGLLKGYQIYNFN